MRTVPLKRYSVYRRQDEMPIILFATAKECATALQIDFNTFRSYLSRQRKGMQYPKRILIYEDEIDEEERAGLIEPPQLTATDCRVLLAYYASGMVVERTYPKVGLSNAVCLYHLKKFSSVTGLNYKDKADLEKMVQIAMERSGEDGK